MNEIQIVIVVVFSIALAGTGFILTWYLNRKLRINEMSMLMEKGLDANEFKSIVQKKNRISWLKIGILLLGISVGAIIAAFLSGKEGMPAFTRIPAFSYGIVILFAGIAMVIANYVVGPKEKINNG